MVDTGVRPIYRLYQHLWSGLDWLFPPTCGGCNALGSRWCQDCQDNTQHIIPPYCRICGIPLDVPGVCPRCGSLPPPYTALRSWASFEGPLKNALHRLKYRRDIGLGETLARPLRALLGTLDWEIESIVPVPLGKGRMAERGYNQVTFLALPLALSMGLPYRPGALHRVRETRSQVGLSAAERRENVRGVFQANPDQVRGRIVLVVDDVATTGATVNSAASALLAAGAARVYGLTLARARGSFHDHPSPESGNSTISKELP